MSKVKQELHLLIEKSADSGLALQTSKGYFPKGHNGPWYHKDTFVRTTAHWALIMFKAFELTEKNKYLNSAVKACNYLTSKEVRPYNYSFYCRDTGNNFCNGLIGQAWAVEPLIIIGAKLGQTKYIDTALEVLSIHPYSFEKNSWSAVEIDGTVLGEYKTLNQQIWFTSMGIILGKQLGESYYLNVGADFFSNIKDKISFLKQGLISHTFSRNKKANKTLSNVYLPFLLYGIALAYDYSKESSVWKNLKIKNIISQGIKYLEDSYPYGYLENNNSYRWSYNPVGIEAAYILQVFSKYLGMEKKIAKYNISKWLNKQFNGYYDKNANLLCNNTKDPNILAARLYECIRLKNYKITFKGEKS